MTPFVLALSPYKKLSILFINFKDQTQRYMIQWTKKTDILTFFSTTTKFTSRRSKDREQICWHFAINNQWEYRFYLLNITFSNHLMFWNFQWLIVFVKVFFVLMHEIYVCIVLLYIHVVSFMLRATMNLRFFQIITRWWVVNASYGAWR